jgi:acetyl-CoA carboxylase alpha subunit
VTDFVPLAGDRAFADDRAIQGGLGRFRGRPVMIMGHREGQRYAKAACDTISAWRSPKATARRFA